MGSIFETYKTSGIDTIIAAILQQGGKIVNTGIKKIFKASYARPCIAKKWKGARVQKLEKTRHSALIVWINKP